MASKIDLQSAGEAFRDRLSDLTQVSKFSDAERDGFSRLLDFYQDRLEAFKEAPRFGEASAYYDNPIAWATRGKAEIGSCLPQDAASQQPIYDAANKGGDALEAVTRAPAAGALASLKGSLLVSQPAVPAKARPLNSPLNAVRPGASFAAFYGPPTSPPSDSDSAGAPPSGPVPPPRPAANDPSWFAKLMTMFPAEAVTAYLTGSQYFDGGKIWLVLVTLAAVVAVRWVALTPVGGRPNVPAVLVSAGSFLLWVGATADASLAGQLQSLLHGTASSKDFQSGLQKAAGFAILVWTWTLPALVKINPDAAKG